MPPKQSKTSDATDEAKAIKLLCILMASAEEFRVDLAQIAPLLGISHSKNVPRRINAVVNPYGYEWKAGKMRGIEGTTDTSAATIDTTTQTSSANTKAATTPTTPKKRKIEARVENDNADESDDH